MGRCASLLEELGEPEHETERIVEIHLQQCEDEQTLLE